MAESMPPRRGEAEARIPDVAISHQRQPNTALDHPSTAQHSTQQHFSRDPMRDPTLYNDLYPPRTTPVYTGPLRPPIQHQYHIATGYSRQTTDKRRDRACYGAPDGFRDLDILCAQTCAISDLRTRSWRDR